MDLLSRIFDTSDFPARWHCGRWTSAHGWLHVLSDLGVWSAYVAIPCVLGYFILRKRDLPFRKIFVLFGAFILACGTTHLMEAIIFWHPVYRLAGLIKLFTAIISWTTVIALVPVIPKVLSLRSPEALEREIAARKEAEAALQQTNAQLQQRVEELRSSEERFRLLVEGTKDHAMYLIDPAGTITSWNPGAERIKGYAADEIIGRHFSQFYLPEDVRSGKPERELQIAEREGRYEEEGLRQRKDGTHFHAGVVITALRNADGTLRGFSKITRDITPRKLAEENAQRLVREEAARRAAEEQADLIAEQRERLHVTLASIGDAVISTDAQGRVTFLNPVAEQLTGWTSADGEGKSLTEVFNIVNEETRQPVENPALRALRDGAIVGLANHTVLISRDGTERPIDDSAAPITNAAGKLFGGVLVFRDVTEHRRTEVANRLLAEVSGALVGPLHYQSILREVAELTIPALGDFCFFDVINGNDRLDRVCWKHIDPAKLTLSDKIREFVPDRDAERHPIAQVIRSGEAELVPHVTEEWLRSIAGDAEHFEILRSLEICSMMSVPLVVGERRLGALTFGYGTSRRRHADDDVRLASEIARRAALTIDNSRLFNQLHDADRKKTEFLAVLAHELRNPLAPITNALQIMRLTDDNDEQIAPLRDMMERQVRQMVHLVDDLLDVSRITRGKIVLRKERLDLADAVRSALEASRPLIDTAKHDLTVTLPAEPVFVEGDNTRLAQVLSNLLANAAKYTPEGGRIWLAVSRDGAEALVRVRDTGIGIPDQMLPLIFDMFTQVDRHLGRSQGGLGIGLTLVRSLVEMHGGSITARSDGPGQGSEFTIRLPAANSPVQSAETSKPNDRPAATAVRRRVLVVDDNRDSAESFGLLLKMLGNDVRMAYDGPGALEAAAAYRPHVVLLDIGLPGISGYDVARRMRQMPEVKEAVLIAQTGWGQDEDRRRSAEAGFNAHIVKPVDANALQAILAALPTLSN